VDEDVERFFEECRADGLCRDKPETFDHLMEILESSREKNQESNDSVLLWPDFESGFARKFCFWLPCGCKPR
jgi:hypothetical protein